ncbi:MAG TPA: hypothetical protein VKG45_14525 [Actinomycetes bacterium]|nr:hypothetical protein [Actinomycetes bacterium]
MTIGSIWWADGSGDDLHLLPGLVSPQLDQLLWMTDSALGSVRADRRPAGVALTFTPRFAGAPANHGVRVDTATGEVEVLAGWSTATPRLRSFIVDVAVADPAVAAPFTTRVRVHVHQGIRSLWLTPPSLTVCQGARGMRFAVLAKFEDDAVGDVTNWSPWQAVAAGTTTFVHAAGSPDRELLWTSDNPGAVRVDADTGVVDARVPLGGARITVDRRSLPHIGASAPVTCTSSWSTPVTVEHVAGPGFAAMGNDDVRNVLFLPDGFEDLPGDRDREAFERYVRVVVARLSHRRRTRPWDLLEEHLNYFRAWLPSPQAGISVLNELDTHDTGHGLTGTPLEQPEPPDPAAPHWPVEALLNEVGVPTPKYDPDGDPLGTVAAGRLADWRTLYGTHVTDPLVRPEYPQWLERNDRVLVNERDTAFHTAMSYRPRVDRPGTERDVQFHPLRLQVDDFELFLANLEDPQHRPVGATWAKGGKDDDMVVILGRTDRLGGSNNWRTANEDDGHYVCMTLRDEDEHRLVAAANGVDVDPQDVPGTVVAHTWTTVAHELAHSLTVTDEYGGLGPITDKEADALVTIANAQPRKELLVGGNLDTQPLKWRWWQRLEKAGLLAAGPVAGAGGSFTLALRPGHARPFRPGDVVRLRTRALVPPPSPAGSPPPAPPPPGTFPTVSDRLQVLDVDPAGDVVTAAPVPPGALVPATFPAGSLVMAPVRGPAAAGLGDDLMLAAASVRARIDATDNPLNAFHGDPPNRPCPGIAATPTPASNFQIVPVDLTPRPPRFSSWIVGAYEGAKRYDCDVYRPTGICVMRVYRYRPEPGRRTRAAEFCPVCRYAMVDLLDPTRHGRIDRDYAPRYPD